MIITIGQMKLFVFYLVVCIPTILAAQSTFTPPESDKVIGENYYEGIRRESNVGSGRISLKSFIIRSNVSNTNMNDSLEARFFLPESLSNQPLEIFFEDLSGSYYMMPEVRNWTLGLQKIKWDATQKARPAGVTLENIRGYVRGKKGPSMRLIAPLTFHGEINDGYFQWIFRADQLATIKYTILNANKEILQNERTLKNYPAGKDFNLDWIISKETLSGTYTLRISYTLLGGVAYSRSEDFLFYYNSK